jgi:uncharacterized protein (DUF952 family)
VTTILHITTKRDWEEAKRNGVYEAPSIKTDGFIHCSTARQTIETANAFFRGTADLVLLLIDEDAARAEVRYEPPASGHSDPNDLFPHLYGPLNLDAVKNVVDFPPRGDGLFELPKSVVSETPP